MHIWVVLLDSGTITKKWSIPRFPALTVRLVQERLECMEEAVVMITGSVGGPIRESLAVSEIQHCGPEERCLRIAHDYEVPIVSEKVVRIITSYMDYPNRAVRPRHLD